MWSVQSFLESLSSYTSSSSLLHNCCAALLLWVVYYYTFGRYSQFQVSPFFYSKKRLQLAESDNESNFLEKVSGFCPRFAEEDILGSSDASSLSSSSSSSSSSSHVESLSSSSLSPRSSIGIPSARIVESLKGLCPESTNAECQRFWQAENGCLDRTVQRLSSYLSWARMHTQYQHPIQAYKQWTSCSSSSRRNKKMNHKNNIDNAESLDLNDWSMALATAMIARQEPVSPIRIDIPRVARTFACVCTAQQTKHPLCDDDTNSKHRIDDDEDDGDIIAQDQLCHQCCCCTCRNGSRIIHITPGKMDDRVIALETYALAIAIYLDRKLPRDNLEVITVMIDTRGGDGWRNLHAKNLLPFIQHCSHLLLEMFPDRLDRAIVYPVPFYLAWIWNMVRHCFDPNTAQKIHLLSGPARIQSPPPADQLAWFVNDELIDRLEADRRASFLPPSPTTSAPSPFPTTTINPTLTPRKTQAKI